MTIEEIRKELASERYDFLRANGHLKGKTIMLGVGGSHAYGTETDESDLDIRGCALNGKREILTYQSFEQYVSSETDTVIYSFNKFISMLSKSNPNAIEMLGLKPEHYLLLTDVGEEFLKNRKLFLSREAADTFGGYAGDKLAALKKTICSESRRRREEHILRRIGNAASLFRKKYFTRDSDSIRLYTDKSEREGYDTEIFMDVSLKHYPLRDYKGMLGEMDSIVKEYDGIGKRNRNAIEHGKLGKHMMHLVRLYLTCFDILEKEEIITCREKDHDFLMSIRNGKYLDKDGLPVPEFFEMIEDFEVRLAYAKKNTSLPDTPDYRRINEFMASVNERVVLWM